MTGITAGGFLNTLPGISAGYVAKFNATGARLWGSYYNIGSDDPLIATSCAADGAGNLYLSGLVRTTFLATTGGFQNTFGGGNSDAVLTKISDNGTPQEIGAVFGAWAGNISLYPNPTRVNFTIEDNIDAQHTGMPINIALYNSLGQCVYVTTLQPSGLHFSKEILLSNVLCNGLYQLRISTDDMQAARQVVIQQ